LEVKLKQKDLIQSFHSVSEKKTTIQSKLEMIETGTANVYYQFVHAYNAGKASEEEIKALIKNELLKDENLNDLFIELDRMTEASNRFITNVLIPNNAILLNQR
jgi:hypothetical protein